MGAILEFVKFAYELKNMLLHIFRLEAKAQPKRQAKESIGATRAASFALDGSRI